MKSKRTLRVLAVVLMLAMMPLWMFGCGKMNSKITANLVEMMIGDGSIKADSEDAAYAASKAYIAALDANVKTISSRMAGSTWPISLATGSQSLRVQHYENMYTMATAWATKGSEYYHSGEILDKVKAALAYAIEDGVKLTTSTGELRKMTVNELCDSAEPWVRTMLILKENGKMDKTVLESSLSVIEQRIPVAYGDASEYIRTLYIALGCALLRDDADVVTNLMTNFAPDVFVTVTSGSGLYADGSFKLSEIASSASYGNRAFATMVEIAAAVKGTDVDFAEEIKAYDFLYNWAKTSVVTSLYNGSAFATLTGSYVADADKLGGKAISGLLGLAEILEDERSDELKSIVKGYFNSNNKAFATGLTSNGACLYQDVAKDDDIAEKKVTGTFSFAEIDKVVILGNKYSAALSMSSDRTVKYETRPIYNESLKEELGGVNGNGWYTGDGMLMLYSDKYMPSSNYWTYVNALRMPGTTIDNRNRDPEHDGNFDGVTSYAGTAVLGSSAVSSFYFINNNSGLISDLTAKKSYFFFGNKIVCLGAGITSTYDDAEYAEMGFEQKIESVIENVEYGLSSAVATSSEKDLTLAANTVTSAPEAMFVMKYGGIYVPKDKNDDVFCRINSTNDGKLNFFELWIDHGKTPSKATYEYVIVPASALNLEKFFEEFVAAPDYEVIANTDTVQAVKDNESGLVGYTFWTGAECNGIKTDFACNMMVKESDSSMTIALSDYTHFGAGNKDGGTITLSGSYTLKNAPAGVSINGNVITIDRAVAANGNTITIELG